jgi:hypothetical protein
MTAFSPLIRTGAPRHALRADPRPAALLVAAVVAGLAALAPAADPGPRPHAGAAPRVALVVDAGARPGAALARARSAAAAGERARTADVAVRVPRSAAEAVVDVRYFAAQRYATVVAVGPLAHAAARASAPAFPRTRFTAPAAVPRTLP